MYIEINKTKRNFEKLGIKIDYIFMQNFVKFTSRKDHKVQNGLMLALLFL